MDKTNNIYFCGFIMFDLEIFDLIRKLKVRSALTRSTIVLVEDIYSRRDETICLALTAFTENVSTSLLSDAHMNRYQRVLSLSCYCKLLLETIAMLSITSAENISSED